MKGICISLFHGRHTATEQLEDWGFDGAVIMNVGFAWTYGSLKIFEIRYDGSFGDMLMLPVYDGMVVLDNKFYGDFEICQPDSDIATNPERTKLTFLELKALIEKTPFTVPTDMKAEAIKNIVNHQMPDERFNVITYIADEMLHDNKVELNAMTDEDLYNYCAHNNVSHIWCHYYLLSI